MSVTDELDTIEKIEAAQEAYYREHGRYLQVKRGNKLPHYEAGTVKGKLGKRVGSAFEIHVYQTPKGEHGYQVFWRDRDNLYSRGYGAEGEDRTYTIPLVLIEDRP